MSREAPPNPEASKRSSSAPQVSQLPSPNLQKVHRNPSFVVGVEGRVAWETWGAGRGNLGSVWGEL
eukprot:1483333-Amphidinium_carterae.1